MMKDALTRCLVGSLLAVTAGCVADLEDDARVRPVRPDRGDATERDKPVPDECRGETVAPGSLSAELAFDETTGLATATVHNTSAHPQTVEVTLHTRDARGGLVKTVAPPVMVPAAQATGVRVAVGDVTGDGLTAHLKAEVVVRDASGAITERMFSHAIAGPPLADVASRLGLPMPTELDGEPVELGAIVKGGVGLDPLMLDAPNDVIDDLVLPPTLPPPTLSYNMCFRWPVTLVDADFGEDYGTNPTSPWIARGGRVSIVRAGQTLFDGYLDATGCTGTFAATGTTDFTVFGYSRARVADNDLIIRDDQGNTRSFVIWDADPGFNQQPVFVFPEVEAVSTLLAVSAYTLQKFHSGMTGKTIPVENRCRPIPNGCCNCSSDGSLWVTSDDRKFLIAHEMGHRLLGLFMGNFNNDVSFDLIPGMMTGTCDATSSHSMWSMEFESGAAMEGWAHFISVATFNSRAGDNPGAMMRYWSGDGVDVDVEQGPTGGASNYFDSVCPSVQSATTLSVQLDWLRHWWDYYTNDLEVDPGYRPTVTRMMNELDAAPAWSAGNAWTRIRTGVKSYSGSTQQARWDQHGAWNGID